MSDPEHMHRCLVRQILAWQAAGDKRSVETIKLGRNFKGELGEKETDMWRGMRDDLNEQWRLGNRGKHGDWR